MRAIRPLLRMTQATAIALCVAASPALAGPAGSLNVSGQVAAAPGRATAAELKAAQASVDAALKVRKQRLDVWQKAAKAKEAGAADVAKKKKAGLSGTALEDALKRALVLDEEAARARGALLAAEAEVAKGGAALLKLYDALLVERKRAIEALPSGSRAAAAQGYRDLSAQRDAVRKALLPVLGSAEPALVEPTIPRGVDLDARADDDVETLLEKADLARDLEARFLRQAEQVRRRILELEEEQAVAREVSGMIGRSQLFDEEDRRLVVTRSETTTRTTQTNGTASRGAPVASVEDDGAEAVFGETDNEPQAPPPASPGDAPPPSAIGSSPAALVTTTTTRTENGFGPQADAAMQGLLTSTSSVESLKALESKLKAQAQSLREKSKKLKTEAQTRARD